MTLIYDFLFLIFAVLYFPYLVLKGKWHEGFLMRFGVFPKDLKENLKAKNNIWIHAVSVGEVLSVAQLIKRIKEIFPNHQLVVSTVTKTGFDIAKKSLPADVLVIFAPLDLSYIVRKYVEVIAPKIYIVAETELWPNIISAIHRKEIPIVTVNGRISDKAFKGYFLFRPLVKSVLNQIDMLCVQGARDAKKLFKLGASGEKIYVVGNIKFDDLPQINTVNPKDFGLSENDLIVVAGSTHPGEEEIILGAYENLLKEFPQLRLVIAPRHIERVEEILKMIERFNKPYIKFSQIQNEKKESNPVIVVDTIGQLRPLYALADVVFVGKSLTVGGGHNLIEPAYFAKPIIVGPHMKNFRDIVELFLADETILQIKNSDEFEPALKGLLQNPEERRRLGQAAKEVVYKNTGATEKTLKIVASLIVRG